MTRPPPKRLLFVVNADWFFVSHRLRLARACIAAGYEVHLATSVSTMRAQIEAEGIEVHSIPIDRGGMNPLADAKTLLSLAALYRRVAPHVIHHVTVKPNIYGGICARTLKIPSVHAVSGLGFVFIDQERVSTSRRFLRRTLLRLYRAALRRKGAITIFQNDTDRQIFLEQGLVTASGSALIPGSGVDLKHFKESPLPPGAPRILLPARMLWDKGVGEFVDAARIVRREFPEARFILLGREDLSNPAGIPKERILEWTREGVVHWVSNVSHEDMPNMYAEASLVVLPSYREGLSLALAEAACCGRACITTDVPGCKDAVVHGSTGWVVPVKDATSLARAISEALSDSAELTRRASQAAIWARENFRQEVVFERTLELYRRLGAGTES